MPPGLDEGLGAEVEGDAAELVEALVVGGGGDPAFADEQDVSWSFAFPIDWLLAALKTRARIVDHQGS